MCEAVSTAGRLHAGTAYPVHVKGVTEGVGAALNALEFGLGQSGVLAVARAMSQRWTRSMEATVLPRTREMLAKDDADPMVPLFRVISRDLFTDVDDRNEIMAGSER